MLTFLAASAVLPGAPISIRLEPLAPSYKLGEKVTFRALARNLGNQTIYLVGQHDGSQSGRKAPICQLQIQRRDGHFGKPETPPGCGNTNPIQQGEFVPVAPGAEFDLLGGMVWSSHEVNLALKAPGAYSFRLRYDTTAPEADWIGGPIPEERHAGVLRWMMPLYEQVPKGVFYSNIARVTIR